MIVNRVANNFNTVASLNTSRGCAGVITSFATLDRYVSVIDSFLTTFDVFVAALLFSPDFTGSDARITPKRSRIPVKIWFSEATHCAPVF